MASRAGQSVIRHLRRAAALSDTIGESDAALLGEFIARRDEAAFAALVRRHGPMVLAVCRRVAGPADADDAFQAAFLVLARKAGTLVDRDLLANWLYGVAYRTALEARTRMLRRRAAEKTVSVVPDLAANEAEDNSELLVLLDRELSRLADKYRVPIVLCELEGRSRREAANLLGIPEGTLSSRLAAARRMLANRLTRRGVAVSAAAVAAALSQGEAAASVPAQLIASTVAGATTESVRPVVLALTQGVLKTMFLKKLQLSAVLTTLGIGAALLSLGALGGRPAAAQPDDKPRPVAGKPDAKPVAGKGSLTGGWKIVRLTVGGEELPEGQGRLTSMFLGKDKGYLTDRDGLGAGFTYLTDDSHKPAHITLVMTGLDSVGKSKLNGIFALSGDDLKMAFHEREGGDKRPESFESPKGSGIVILELKRDPAVKEPDPRTVDEKVKQAQARTMSGNNLKQLGLAMHNYMAANRSFPAAAIFSKDGKPLLSWRVAILPYINQDALYRAFRLDEPWDSEHNKKLLKQMPQTYGANGTETHYRVFTGKDTVFPESRGLRPADIRDGTSNTILIVEAPDAVPWTKPDEIEYDANKPLPKLGGKPHANGFLAVFCDGAVRMLSNKTTEKTLRALITPAGDEAIDPEKKE